MRILLVSPFQPHRAANHGGGSYLGLLVVELAQHATMGVVHYAFPDDQPPMPEIDSVFSTPRIRRSELGSGSLLREKLRNLWRWGIRGLPLEVAKTESAGFRRELRRAVAEFQPDVVLVEFVVMAWCLEELRRLPAPPKLVFTDHERGESVPRRLGPGGFGVARDRRLYARYVRHFYPMADLCQALTTKDAAHLERLTGRPVEVRSPLVEIPDRAAAPADAAPVMLFLGDYLHHPNPEAARILAREVMPVVRRDLPESELWLAGPRATEEVQQLGQLDGVRYLGFVDDLPDLMGRVRCLAAPVFSGFGVRIKSLSGMAFGLPLVTTRLGLQGIDPPAAAVRTGETPTELAEACLFFLRDAAAAGRAGATARKFVHDTFSGARIAQQQIQRFEALSR